MILPLFVPYYTEIPQVSGTTFGGISVSAKSMNYILGLQVIASSSANIVVGLAAVVSNRCNNMCSNNAEDITPLSLHSIYNYAPPLDSWRTLPEKSVLAAKVDIRSQSVCFHL